MQVLFEMCFVFLIQVLAGIFLCPPERGTSSVPEARPGESRSLQGVHD